MLHDGMMDDNLGNILCVALQTFGFNQNNKYLVLHSVSISIQSDARLYSRLEDKLSKELTTRDSK